MSVSPRVRGAVNSDVIPLYVRGLTSYTCRCAGQTPDPHLHFEEKGGVRLPTHGCAGGHKVPYSACWFGAPAAVGGGAGARDRPGGDGGVRPGWLRQVDVAGGLGAALPVAGGVAIAGCWRQRPGPVLAVCGRGAGGGAAGGGRAGRRAAG